MILYIANRGEIARRIIRTAKKMGIKTAVGFADGDRELPFVGEADLALPLHGEESKDTYLNTEKVLAAASTAGAGFIHPGYGFLSESPQFVDLVEMSNLKFVGPSAETMRLLGDKMGSRRFLRDHGISLLPCYDGEDQNTERLIREAKHLGFPLLLKPSAGGGGKGMFRINSAGEIRESLESSRRIAKAAFNDDRVFFERYLEKSRHIEVQILADAHGHVHILGERECSLQRRHQKVVEEAPCAFLPQKLREKIYSESKRIAEKAGYVSAGTVEWIWDGAEGIYFLEVNARVQVEHPVTEMITGLDVIEWQLRIAQNESIENLKFKTKGHAIEARVCAEDPALGFLPTGGKIEKLVVPRADDLRVDFGFREGNVIPSTFDSLLGKVIAYGGDRETARLQLIAGLQKMWIAGPKTNRGYLVQILKSQLFKSGALFTDALAAMPYQFDSLLAVELLQELKSGGGAGAVSSEASDLEDLDVYSPWGAVADSGSASVAIDFEDRGNFRHIHTAFEDWAIARPRAAGGGAAVQENLPDEFEIRSPMPAKVIRLSAAAGQRVTKGEVLLVLEAMKMEHQMKAPQNGVIESVHCVEGGRVAVDSVLIKLERKAHV